MLSGGVDRHAGADVTAGVMLQHVSRSLRGIETHGLDVSFDIDIFIRPDMPAKSPVHGKVIPDIDIVVDNYGNLAKAGPLRPCAVHELAHLADEFFFQRDDKVRAAAASFLQAQILDRNAQHIF